MEGVEEGLEMPEAEPDLRLQRLLSFYDAVCAIAATLLAVELILPQAASTLHGDALLGSLLSAWPMVLAFLTSFVFIATFWVGNNLYFYHVRRFDVGLMWLVLVQLMFIAFLPFPTSVLSEHVSDPVAQQFYLANLLLISLVTVAMWWYMSSKRHRLVDAGLSAQFVRRCLLRCLTVPMCILVVMGLVAVGVGRYINPLLLTYFFALGYMVLEGLEGHEFLTEAEAEEFREEEVEDVAREEEIKNVADR
jgi:uncharacterized membrane protein